MPWSLASSPLPRGQTETTGSTGPAAAPGIVRTMPRTLSAMTNNRRYRAMAVAAAFLAGCAWAPTRDDRHPPRDRSSPLVRSERPELDLASLRAQVREAHNRIRAGAKLPPLTVSEKLQAAAQSHAQDMAARRTMSHVGTRRSSPFDRIKSLGYQYRRAGENVA